MKIRSITENDISNWSRMRTILWPDTSDNHLSEIKKFFSGESIDIKEVFLVEAESSPIGFIELNIRNFAEGSSNSKIPYVEAWYIDSDFQNQGFGKALMQKAEEWAISNGFDEIASDTELENNKSISMHKHLGYIETERVVCFLKKLKNA